MSQSRDSLLDRAIAELKRLESVEGNGAQMHCPSCGGPQWPVGSYSHQFNYHEPGCELDALVNKMAPPSPSQPYELLQIIEPETERRCGVAWVRWQDREFRVPYSTKIPVWNRAMSRQTEDRTTWQHRRQLPLTS